MNKEIIFTADEKRFLGVPQSENPQTPEALTLRKILDHFPWMILVVECDYDPIVRHYCLQAASAHSQVSAIIGEYRQRKKEESK